MPTQESVPPQQIPLIAGLAVREAVATLTSADDIKLKWPNDLLHHNCKLAGLLCERVDNVDLVGLGLNVNVDPARAPADLRPIITSMQKIAGESFSITDVLIEVARSLAKLYRRRLEQPFSTFVKDYGRHDGLLGKTVTISATADQPPLTGKSKGIDAAGRLLISRRGKTHAIVAGNVTLGTARNSNPTWNAPCGNSPR